MSPNTKTEKVIQKIYAGARLLNTYELKGGVSTVMTMLEIQKPDGKLKKLILRQPKQEALKKNSRAVRDEFRLLKILHTVGLKSPKPIFLDESKEFFPEPYLVVEYIEGGVEFSPLDVHNCVAQLAENLVNIHNIDCSKFDLSFLPKQESVYAAKLNKRSTNSDETLQEELVRKTLKSTWPLAQLNKPVLLHGDLWLGNVLWKNKQLVAVIDWGENTTIGDPLVDLAITRLEMLWTFDNDTMIEFTDHYKSKMKKVDFTNLPYWDLCTVLRPAFKIEEWAEKERVKSLRDKYKIFINDALKTINEKSN